MAGPELRTDDGARDYPVHVLLPARTADRNRLTCAFRLILALPHLILVGGPMAAVAMWGAGDSRSAGGGFLGLVAILIAIASWFAIVFTGRHPRALWGFSTFFLRWRVRALAYAMLLRDEYPPFGEGDYPAELHVARPEEPRNRLTVGLRLLLALPHILILGPLGVAWIVASVIAWFAIVLTGSYPAGLYRFATGALRWETRVEAYLLLLRDEYPPFSFR